MEYTVNGRFLTYGNKNYKIIVGRGRYSYKNSKEKKRAEYRPEKGKKF